MVYEYAAVNYVNINFFFISYWFIVCYGHYAASVHLSQCLSPRFPSWYSFFSLCRHNGSELDETGEMYQDTWFLVITSFSSPIGSDHHFSSSSPQNIWGGWLRPGVPHLLRGEGWLPDLIRVWVIYLGWHTPLSSWGISYWCPWMVCITIKAKLLVIGGDFAICAFENLPCYH